MAHAGTVGHRTWFPAFLLAALILGTFAYLVLVLILPFIFGLWALLIAVFVAAEILYAHHRHRRKPRKKSLIVWDPPVKGPAMGRPWDKLEAWVVGTFLFIVFAVVVWTVGIGVQVTNFGSAVNLPVYLTGVVLVRLALAMLFAKGVWGLGTRMGPGIPTESERYDTTEDH